MADRLPIDPNSAVDAIIAMAPRYAKAKAERVYLEEFRKSKKAILMQASESKVSATQERDAYAHQEYIGLLAALQVATETEEALRWKMIAAQLRVEVWRTTESSNRMIDRAAR